MDPFTVHYALLLQALSLCGNEDLLTFCCALCCESPASFPTRMTCKGLDFLASMLTPTKACSTASLCLFGSSKMFQQNKISSDEQIIVLEGLVIICINAWDS